MNRPIAARTLAALLCCACLAACQSIEPPRPEPDPAQPPPAPITPPPQLLPPHGRVVTAPLPGRPEPAPVVAPARLTLRAFQRDHGLPDSGRLDEATRQALTAPR